MVKKVFSAKKYKTWCDAEMVRTGRCYSWSDECRGKTEQEMLELGYDTIDEWMMEVEDSE